MITEQTFVCSGCKIFIAEMSKMSVKPLTLLSSTFVLSVKQHNDIFQCNQLKLMNKTWHDVHFISLLSILVEIIITFKHIIKLKMQPSCFFFWRTST